MWDSRNLHPAPWLLAHPNVCRRHNVWCTNLVSLEAHRIRIVASAVIEGKSVSVFDCVGVILCCLDISPMLMFQ